MTCLERSAYLYVYLMQKELQWRIDLQCMAIFISLAQLFMRTLRAKDGVAFFAVATAIIGQHPVSKHNSDPQAVAQEPPNDERLSHYRQKWLRQTSVPCALHAAHTSFRKLCVRTRLLA